MSSSPGDSGHSPAGSDLLARLANRGAIASRYAEAHEIARGGMGAILEVRDLDLRRKLAMKVLRERGAVDRAQLQRFLEEAQVTAQLDHPGVVPVHEIGLDEEGRVYFTMALVRGRDLEHVFSEVRAGAPEWTRSRALEVLLKVCDTMAFAHAQGVIHRDLKPGNVMVGSFGEVYVMDWGLAKLAGAREGLSSERREATAAVVDGESSLVTQDGAIVGTPAYMSPEQARGEELDARADVYALGAMLYALCAGRAPYTSPNVPLSALQIVTAIRKGPPARLESLTREPAPELVAICEKAMAREREQRYADMRALGEDLRRYIEGRVVRAYRTGAWVEFKKWVLRNKGMAGALAGVLVALLAGGIAFSIKESQRADQAQRVLRLSDAQTYRDLVREDAELWPPTPDRAQALAAWVAKARAIHSKLDEHKATRASLAALAGDKDTDRWWIGTLDVLIADIERLPPRIAAVEERAKFAATVQTRTVEGPEARARWEKALAAIAAEPRYAGTKLVPQLGLLPLEADPQSGLWEFWHVQSGAEPKRGDDGRWRIEPETGIVLVLLPGATTSMGSKPGVKGPAYTDKEYDDRADKAPDFDTPWVDYFRNEDEMFFETVQLDPFFVSKYEMTQSQWQRVMGTNPSQHFDARTGGGRTHPVANLNWSSAIACAQRLSLALPTEARWEYAARAGTTTPFPNGTRVGTLQGVVNLKDRAWGDNLRRQGVEIIAENMPDDRFMDGWVLSAPVGSFPANAFGVHEIIGNVWEWCLEPFDVTGPPRPGDGARDEARPNQVLGTIRGGSYFSDVPGLRPANRYHFSQETSEGDVGVRFVRALQP